MDEELKREIWAFIDENRSRALWWVRDDYYPQTAEQARDLLDKIAQHCTRIQWVKARKLKQKLQ